MNRYSAIPARAAGKRTGSVRVLLVFGFAWAFASVFAWTFASAQDATSPANGSDLYKTSCASCHGADGRANTKLGAAIHAANLQSPEVQKLSDEDLKKTIIDGKGNMPPFGDQLAPADIARLVNYLRVLGHSTKP